MRRCTWKACAAALAFATLVPVARAFDPSGVPASPAGQSRVERVQTTEKALLAAINVVRGRRGLRPFRASPQLGVAAFAHSEQMARLGYFEHASANGTAFWRRIQRIYSMRGFRGWSVGENIAEGSPGLTPQEALDEWLRSPPHRANIFSREWRDAGIGAVFATAAPGFFGGAPTLVVTLDLGARQR
jgi:uncharacterized protein YkwD